MIKKAFKSHSNGTKGASNKVVLSTKKCYIFNHLSDKEYGIPDYISFFII